MLCPSNPSSVDLGLARILGGGTSQPGSSGPGSQGQSHPGGTRAIAPPRTRSRCGGSLPTWLILLAAKWQGARTQSELASDQVTARDAMTPNPVSVNRDTPVSEAMERMAALGIGRLPVVDGRERTHLIGMFMREDVIAARTDRPDAVESR